MLLASVSRLPVVALVYHVPRYASSIISKPAVCRGFTQPLQPTRLMATEARAARRAAARSQTWKERLMAPAGESAFTMGRGLVAGASALGLGALCFYGLGMSSEVGTIERAALWPEEVRRRVRDTYMYFGASIVATAASAVAVSRTPTLMNLVMKRSWLSLGATFACMIGSGMLCMSLPYTEGVGVKQLAWLVHTGVMGAVVAPLTVLGGPILVRAAWYTAGIVAALSTVAMCAPSERFLNMGGPLAIGFGLVLASSIGGMFLPPTTALGAGLYSVSVYGGLVLFGLFLLYDTQKVMKRAETHSSYSNRPYDPINGCIGIYADTLNIFIRVAMILSNSGGGRRK